VPQRCWPLPPSCHSRSCCPQVGKGRDMGAISILQFFSKLSQGTAQMSTSRQALRLGQRLSLGRLLGFYYTHIGYYAGQESQNLKIRRKHPRKRRKPPTWRSLLSQPSPVHTPRSCNPRPPPLFSCTTTTPATSCWRWPSSAP
jgi:hypothetical protein